MDEGFSDYFANAPTDSVTYGGPSDQSSDPSLPSGEGVPSIRYTYNTYTMNNWGDWDYYHPRSQIISGAVWMIRRLTNMAAVMDDLTEGGLLRHPQSFASFGEALYDEDAAVNSKANWQKIETEFVKRKILEIHLPDDFSYTQSDDDLEFSWSDDSRINTGYDFEHRLNGGAWNALEELGATATSATHEDVLCKAGENYHEYRLRVYNATYEAYTPIDNFDPCYPERVAVDQIKIQDFQVSIHDVTPATTTLDESYPNPFNPTTIIGYTLHEGTHVTLRVFDVLGREVRILVNDEQRVGTYEVSFDASSLPNGVYIYTLTTKTTSITKSMTLTK